MIEALKAIVGAKYCLSSSEDLAPFLKEERGNYQGTAEIVVLPGNTQEVAALVKYCTSQNIAIVPQGGNTGLCGGAVGFVGQVILNLKRLDQIGEVNRSGFSLEVGAGAILANIQQKAAAAGRYFPLSLASEGSCQIGGLLSTNAGGVAVLRYGNARELCLGLEVVTPAGEVLDLMAGLAKDNTGYALKHLFIGAEGTLGIITRAKLKLFPAIRDRLTCFIGLKNPTSAVGFLELAKEEGGDLLSACELISADALEFVLKHIKGVGRPLASAYPYYLLAEFSSSLAEIAHRAGEVVLALALEREIIEDVVIAQSGDQALRLWKIRESIPEAQKHEGGSIKHDISVPLDLIPEFIQRASAKAKVLIPGIRIVDFGHVGDGNIHFNLSQPLGADKAEFLARWQEVATLVHDIACGLGGSFSAEHGIGLLKREDMGRYKSGVELELQQAIKAAFDRTEIMNPGKIIEKI